MYLDGISKGPLKGFRPFQAMALVPMYLHDFLDELTGFGSTSNFYFGDFFSR